jgi:hypothetical protein
LPVETAVEVVVVPPYNVLSMAVAMSDVDELPPNSRL